MPSFELLLPLGALAFYVYDCGLLLYDNELLFQRSRRRWRVGAGSNQLLFGRRLCLPGLLQPWLALYRLQWNDAPEPVTVPGAAVALPAAPGVETAVAVGLVGLLPLQCLCSLMLLLLLPVLPLVSLGYGAGWAMLGVFTLYYLLVIVALLLVWLRRRQWQLSGRAFASLALDALACAPFAANLLRRVTLQQRYTADGLAAARALCAAPERRELLDVLRARLGDRIAATDDDNEAARLARRRQQLEVELA
jgi:hypothetical protein